MFLVALVGITWWGCGSDSTKETDLGAGMCSTEIVTEWSAGVLRLNADDCASFGLSPRILGDGSMSVTFNEVEGAWQPEITAHSDAIFRGLVLEGPHQQMGQERPVMWRQGYQSWSFSGVVDLLVLDRDEDGVPPVGGDGDAAAVAFEQEGTSWWMGAIGKPDGASLFAGALQAHKNRVFVAAEPENMWVVWGHRGDGVELRAGEIRTLDPVWVSAGTDPNSLYESYAQAVVEHLDVSTPTAPPLTGWATWYHFFEDITETDVRANLSFASSLRSSPPLDVFQIDDGWQKVWGDWIAADDFPSGMSVLAEDIAAAGFIPGLWMAPFYVDRSTATYQDNPDWWVRNLDGEELRFLNLNTGDYAVLDVTHPDAADWLGNLISTKVEQGWTYLKLDFLYAGAQVGQRSEAVTGLEAYQRGMRIIREAAGDAWILACGAPMLPSVGHVQSFRTGADIAFGFDRIPKLDYLRWAARSTAARGWSNGVWWWVDPDQILIKPPFDDVQSRGAVVANAVSGGVWMLGDDLPALSEARLNLALEPTLMAMRGMRGVPRNPVTFVSGIDPGPPFEGVNPNDQVPHVWDFPDGSVALLNMGMDAVEVEGPGGTELLTGEVSEPGSRVLEPGLGEIWLP